MDTSANPIQFVSPSLYSQFKYIGSITMIRFFYINHPQPYDKVICEPQSLTLFKSCFERTSINPCLLHQEIRQNDPLKESKIIENIIHIRETRSEKSIKLLEETRHSEKLNSQLESINQLNLNGIVYSRVLSKHGNSTL